MRKISKRSIFRFQSALSAGYTRHRVVLPGIRYSSVFRWEEDRRDWVSKVARANLRLRVRSAAVCFAILVWLDLWCNQLGETFCTHIIYKGIYVELMCDCCSTGNTWRRSEQIPKFIIYPLDVVKSRLQRDALASAIVTTSSPHNTQHMNGQPSRSSLMRNSFGFKAAFDLFQQLMNKSNGGGIKVLYSGLSISAFRSFFQHGVMWTILESVRNQIQVSCQTWWSIITDTIKLSIS